MRSNRSRCHSINTQTEAKTSKILGMEEKVFGIHGPIGQHLSTTAIKGRKSNNSAYKCRTARCSTNTCRRRMLETTVQRPQIHTHQRHLRRCSNTCRQDQDGMGPEVYKQLCDRFALPVGTRSIGYRIPHNAKIRQQQL